MDARVVAGMGGRAALVAFSLALLACSSNPVPGGGGVDAADCDADPAACACAGDGQCGGATPRCDRNTGRCVPCLPLNDNCPAGSRCLPVNATFACSASCRNDGDCPKSDAGVQTTCCNGACVDTSSDVRNCGACARACAAVQNGEAACAAGTCAIGECSAGFADCDEGAANGCETNITSDTRHCGGCGKACAAGANASPTCGASVCGFACGMGFGDCDKDAANGCETNIATDLGHCGACGATCGKLPNATSTCAAGVCSVSACDFGFADCDKKPENGCEIDLLTNQGSCGACGKACGLINGGEVACKNGNCAIGKCDADFADCDGLFANGCEISTKNDAKNCGRCGRSCAGANSTQSCQAGACVVTACVQGFADCDMDPASGCEVNTSSNAMHCGGCGKACMAAPNANVTCVNAGCMVTGCKFGFADCNKSPQDGCEADLLSIASCGMCGNTCPAPPNATAGCNGGVCGVGMCAPLFGNCDGNAANGCERSLASDLNSCGACGRVCQVPNGTPSCLGGQCGIASCNASFVDCDMSAVNGCEVHTLSDPKNCGGCGKACPAPMNAAPSCANATCGAACNFGFGDCNNNLGDGCETNLAGDVGNCGVCGRVCPQLPNGTSACKNGNCGVGMCNPGFADCNLNPADGCERNVATDIANCGQCGKACSFPNAQPACLNGQCGVIGCNAGFADCDGQMANGCEVDVTRDPKHCGRCNNACPMNTPYCNKSQCDVTPPYPVACTQGKDLSGSNFVICAMNQTGGWIAGINNAGVCTYGALEVCKRYGFTRVTRWGGTCGTVCGYCNAYSCMNPEGAFVLGGNYTKFDSGGGNPQNGGNIGCTVHWECAP